MSDPQPNGSTDLQSTQARATATRATLVCILLASVTAAVYAPVLGHGFLTYDDNLYVTANAQVKAGLTVKGVHWAWRTSHTGYWHPLTWLSHMLDVELFGLNPAGHHLTNVLWHALNALLLFALLTAATGRAAAAAIVAGLFALHPLRVESVAWVAERKDVLSGALGLVSIAVYVAYARRGGTSRYLLALALLALGLAAKPMLVTLPFVYLLLDFWPLRRVQAGQVGKETGDRSAARRRGRRSSLARLCAEKVPFVVLAMASSTFAALDQQSVATMATRGELASMLRVDNAVAAYAGYIGKMFWPAHLSVLYPHPYLAGGTPLSRWVILAAAVLLCTATVLMICVARRGYLTVGWLWFLGMLVPVIGLVQVGAQAMADRYTYLPLIGLFIMAGGGGAELCGRFGSGRPWFGRVVSVAAVAVLAACAVGTRQQLAHWRSSKTLYQRALQVAPNNPIILNNLGNVLLTEGRFDEAIDRFRTSLRLWPTHVEALNNLANALRSTSRVDEAIDYYRVAEAVAPRNAGVQYNLGIALQMKQQVRESIKAYRRAVTLNPDFAAAQYNLGLLLAKEGDLDGAIKHFRLAHDLQPDLAHVRQNLDAVMQMKQRN